MAAPLKLEVGAVYVTPTGRRCFWRPGPPSEEPLVELDFEYFGGKRPETFTLTPLNAQRMLRREGRRP